MIFQGRKITNIDFSVSFLKQEIRRCESLGINKLVLHPGSHVGKGVQVGLNNIIEALNKTLEPDMNIIICLQFFCLEVIIKVCFLYFQKKNSQFDICKYIY